MCPHGYHHKGLMATPALGTQDVCVRCVYNYFCILKAFCKLKMTPRDCQRFSKLCIGICLPMMPLGGDSEYVNPYIPPQTPEEDESDHMQLPLYMWPDV